MISKIRQNVFCMFILLIVSPILFADGSSIDKVYLPYVQFMEKEIEYRVLMENDNATLGENYYLHKLGLGKAVREKLFIEAYVISSDYSGVEMKTEAYELELRYQLSEQGQFAIDWGVMFELEKYARRDVWEAKAGVLATGNWKRIQNSVNVFLISEWGADLDNEQEAALSFQSLYRYSPALEPGLEFYMSQDTAAVGPIITGQIKLEGTHKVYWHFGVIHGFNEKIPNNTIKLHFEYEFI